MDKIEEIRALHNLEDDKQHNRVKNIWLFCSLFSIFSLISAFVFVLAYEKYLSYQLNQWSISLSQEAPALQNYLNSESNKIQHSINLERERSKRLAAERKAHIAKKKYNDMVNSRKIEWSKTNN